MYEFSFPTWERKLSNAGKKVFQRWKFYFPPLEIYFSKGGNLLETLATVSFLLPLW